MISLLASIIVGTNAVTFTATSTGIGVGTPVEFFLAGKGSDRDYETAFLLDDDVADLAQAFEKAGLPRGRAPDARSCVLWPVGRNVTIRPAIGEFVQSTPLEGTDCYPCFCYTGGTRDHNGQPIAADEMPKAVVALYSCPQSLFLFNGIFPQEMVYSRHVITNALEKGTRREFTVSWPKTPSVRPIALTLHADNAKQLLETLRSESNRGDVDVTVSFGDDASIGYCADFAKALSLVDSVHVKINGCVPGNLFYRAFQPLEKWRDRKERLVQPFEIRLDASGSPTVTRIDEDWSVEGIDPRLTAVTIPIEKMAESPKIDTALFFAPSNLKFKDLKKVLVKLPKTVHVFYVYAE